MNRHAIVITVEGISPSLIGALGSNTAETPVIDAIAAQGVVLDQCFLDSRVLEEMLISLWTGQHALSRQFGAVENAGVSAATEASIWHSIHSAGGIGVLVTDCAQTASLAERFGCQQVELVELSRGTEPASELFQCSMLSLFSAAAEVFEELGQEQVTHKLCWIHSKGLRLPWDAPVDLRNSFRDGDDPEPTSEVGPPQLEVTAETDPDVVVGWSQVAAAQAAVLDQSLMVLETMFRDEWSWCILGIDGCPLGEHGWIGYGQESLHEEQLQVTAIFRPWPAPAIGWRVAEICQLPDVAATIADLCGLPCSGDWGRSQLNPPEDASPIECDAKHQVALMVEDDKT